MSRIKLTAWASTFALAAACNAIVGIDIDYEVMGKENGMLMVSASGTAVIVE